MPRISDLTQQIRGATVFSSLDLKHALWQLDVRRSDRKYTVFCTSLGNFEYNKLPLGLTYASRSFRKFINHIMNGTEAFCFCYIDDILVFSAEKQEHKIHLHEVANRLNAYCLKLNMDKCSFGVKEITTLGYTVSAKGITASREKVKAIQNLPERLLSNSLGTVYLYIQ